MKRLLCIVSSLNAGGAETFLMKIYRTLDKSKYQMDFVVSELNGFYEDEVKENGGRVYFVPMRTAKPISAFFEIKKIVKDNKYPAVLKLCDTPDVYKRQMSYPCILIKKN